MTKRSGDLFFLETNGIVFIYESPIRAIIVKIYKLF